MRESSSLEAEFPLDSLHRILVNQLLVLFVVVTVAERERVVDLDRLGDVVRDRVPEEDFVGRKDAGTVKRVLGLTLTDRVRVTEMVGLIDLVNGQDVAMGLRLRVTVTERVTVTDRVRERVPVGDFVVKKDAGTVNRVLGLRVTVTDRVSVTDRVRERVPVGDFVCKRDAGTVN